MRKTIRSAVITFEKALTSQEFAVFQIVMSNIKPVQAMEPIDPSDDDLTNETAEQKVRVEAARQLVDLAQCLIERKCDGEGE